MADPRPLEEKLKKTFLKRIEKMQKLRRSMRLWGAAGAVCAIVASAPIVYFLFTGNMPALSFDMPIYISPDWAVVIGMLAVGLFGSMVFYSQFKRAKDKLDKMRSGAVALLQSSDAVCDCNWLQCTCKDDVIRDMHDKYDINLSY